MVKLVYTQGLGPCARKSVGVRVSPSAPGLNFYRISMAEIFELPSNKKPDESAFSQETADAMKILGRVLHDSSEIPFYVETNDAFTKLANEVCQQYDIDELTLDLILSGPVDKFTSDGQLSPDQIEKINALQEQIPAATIKTLRAWRTEIRLLESIHHNIVSKAKAYREALQTQKGAG